MTLKLRKALQVRETLMPAGVYRNMPVCAVNAIIDVIGWAEFCLNVVPTPDPVDWDQRVA